LAETTKNKTDWARNNRANTKTDEKKDVRGIGLTKK
jgi:hypothetical protein